MQQSNNILFRGDISAYTRARVLLAGTLFGLIISINSFMFGKNIGLIAILVVLIIIIFLIINFQAGTKMINFCTDKIFIEHEGRCIWDSDYSDIKKIKFVNQPKSRAFIILYTKTKSFSFYETDGEKWYAAVNTLTNLFSEKNTDIEILNYDFYKSLED